MRILIISFPGQSEYIGGEDQIAQILLSELVLLNHEVSICDRNNYDCDNEYDYDLILSLNHPLKILQKKKTIWATWVFNENIGRNIEEIKSNNYDIYFTNSTVINFSLEENSYKSLFVPFPSFDYYQRKSPLISPNNKKTDIIYLGNYNPEYKSVDKLNSYLIPCLNYSFEIYGGKKWSIHEQKRLFDKGIFQAEYFCEAYEYYYKGIFPIQHCPDISDYAKIFINFNSPGQIKLGMINNRMFDLLSNGCFIITDDNNIQREIFGDCVEYSSGGEDLKEKIDYYLANPDLIYSKQKKALEFSSRYQEENSYTKAAQLISDYAVSNYEEIIENRKSVLLCFAIIVNNIDLLDNCIKSITSGNFDKVKYKFYISNDNRIRATKIINKNLSDKYEIVLIDCNLLEYRVPYSDIDFKNIIIPTYSNIIYYEKFCQDIYDLFFEDSNIDIVNFPMIDCSDYQREVFGIEGDSFSFDQKDNCFIPYGFYAVNYRNKLSLKEESVKWNDLCENNIISYSNNCSNIIFETEDQRKSFIYNNYEETIMSLSHGKSVNKHIENNVYNNLIDIPSIRFSILSKKDFEIEYKNIEKIITEDKNIEEIIRRLESHYTVLCSCDIDFDLQNIANIIISHMNYDVFLVKDVLFVKTSLMYLCNPANSIVDLGKNILSDKALSSISINPKTYDIQIFNNDKSLIQKKENGLKIAVLSMCGVSSYEDRYGIGGEHQVIHWLKQSFDKREDVQLCQIFDTYNYDLMDPDEYDIIFSNSCWRSMEHKRKRRDNLTIFWHFNMDSGKATLDTVIRMEYDIIWTNSYVGYDYFKSKSIKCMMKQLNASSKYHFSYPYESSLYKHDVTYIGGYQVHYKGKELIDNFIKPCCGQSFDFAIYGNRLWKAEVQKQALSTDSYFKEEYYDESFEPYYRKILPMQDFNILAKNTKIWINFNAASQEKMNMVNDRPIWALACGAFVITDDVIANRRFFDGDNCPVVFSTGGQDLVEKIRYYLEHEDERLEIASKGPDFIKKNKLYTDDTIDQVMDLYYNRDKYES